VPVEYGDCRCCGVLFVVRPGSGAVCCSDVCTRRLAKQKERRRRRMLERSAVSADYDRREIFERDGWRCQLCGGRLHRKRVVPHPKAPTIDHILPLSAGGDDAPWNVQAAHFECNSRKAAGVAGAGEQLMLPA